MRQHMLRSGNSRFTAVSHRLLFKAFPCKHSDFRSRLLTVSSGNRKQSSKQSKGLQTFLFPALMKDNPQPFEELLAAMAHRRRTTVSLDEFVRRQEQASKRKPSKKEMGRRLRLTVLDLHPDDLTSMRAVLIYLGSRQVEYSDESHVRRVMRELDIHLLKPGETVFFYFSVVDLRTGQPKKWHCLRKIIVGKNGTATNYGMSRKEYDELLGCKSHRVQPIRPDK